MKKIILTVVFVVLLAALSAAYLQWQAQRRDRTTTAPTVEVPTAPSPATALPRPRYPIPQPPATEQSRMPGPIPPRTPAQAAPEPDALPALNDSNTRMTEVFTRLFGVEPLHALFVPDELVRRFVVTLDTLPHKKLPPRQQLLLRAAAGPLVVTGVADRWVISPDNAARYAPYVQLAARTDAQQLVDAYIHFYPLFQAAYAELGAPNAYFNDRLVEVLDHLLDAPNVVEPIHVVQPKVFYEYAAPGLEALSAGHKIMLRMGRANAEQIKAKLREIRQALTHEAPPSGAEQEQPAADADSPAGDWRIVP